MLAISEHVQKHSVCNSCCRASLQAASSELHLPSVHIVGTPGKGTLCISALASIFNCAHDGLIPIVLCWAARLTLQTCHRCGHTFCLHFLAQAALASLSGERKHGKESCAENLHCIRADWEF